MFGVALDNSTLKDDLKVGQRLEEAERYTERNEKRMERNRNREMNGQKEKQKVGKDEQKRLRERENGCSVLHTENVTRGTN